MLNIPLPLRLTMIAGALLFLLVLFILLRRKRLNVQYSIIWLGAALIMLLVAVFPVIIAVLGNILKIEMPVNLVFTLLFVFVLLLLLSLSTIVTGFSGAIKRLTQTQALLEERVRRLETQLRGQDGTQNAMEDTPAPGDGQKSDAGTDGI